MSLSKVLVFGVLVLLNQSSASATFREHLARVEGFKCGVPQPRLVPLEHIFSKEELNSSNGVGSIEPSGSVLHRCEGSGYCGSGKNSCRNDESTCFCGFSKFENVNLWFLKKGSQKPFIQMALNHTECSCQSRKDNPK